MTGLLLVRLARGWPPGGPTLFQMVALLSLPFLWGVPSVRVVVNWRTGALLGLVKRSDLIRTFWMTQMGVLLLPFAISISLYVLLGIFCANGNVF